VTVAAVALIVDGGSLVTADALLPHVEETHLSSARLRLAFGVFAGREERGGPLGHCGLLRILGGQRLEDRPALGFGGLGRDPGGHHQKRVMAQ